MVSGRVAALLEENIMNPTVCTHKNNPNFWIFGLFFFLYFFIMATCFPFLPIWLSDVIGLNKTETGLVFSSLSLFAICFQPILGVISDKLGLKKHLMWIVTVLLVLIAPFFLYVFAPLLKTQYLARGAERRRLYRLCILRRRRRDGGLYRTGKPQQRV